MVVVSRHIARLTAGAAWTLAICLGSYGAGVTAAPPRDATSARTPADLLIDDFAGGVAAWEVNAASSPWASDADGTRAVETPGAAQGVPNLALGVSIDPTRGTGKATAFRTYPLGEGIDLRGRDHLLLDVDTEVPLLVGFAIHDRNERYFTSAQTIVPAGRSTDVALRLTPPPGADVGAIRRLFINASGYGADSRFSFDNLRAARLGTDADARPATQPALAPNLATGAEPGLERVGGVPAPIEPIVGSDRLRAGPPAHDGPPTVSIAAPSSGADVARGSLLELTLDLAAAYDNPYDADAIDVSATFTSPAGRKTEVPAFYYWPFERRVVEGQEQLVAGERPQWLVRFTPMESGAWSVVPHVRAEAGSAAGAPFEFTCAPADAAGFIRVGATNKFAFVDDRGDTYFPIGVNMAWAPTGPRDGNLETLAYDQWLEALAANGGNFVRLWLAPWGFAPEWTSTGLGNYDERQAALWRLDYVLRRCDELGIRAMICLINHGQFSTGANAQWNENPFNAANGGPLARPVDFLTDETARNLYARRLRYLMARYAHSPAVMCWEWFNEMNLMDGFEIPELRTWTAEMADVVRRHDPNHHLLTTSMNTKGSPLIWDMPSIDFTQLHVYEAANWTLTIPAGVENMKAAYGKPSFFGEFGLEPADARLDPDGWQIHNGAWASLFGGAAGTAMSWWWDSYLFGPDRNLYPRLRGFARFVDGLDLQQRDIERETIAFVHDGTPMEARYLHLHDVSYLWVRRADSTAAAAHILRVSNAWFPVSQGVDVPRSARLAAGSDVSWWSTEEGDVIESAGLAEGSTIPAPTFTADIAAQFRSSESTGVSASSRSRHAEQR